MPLCAREVPSFPGYRSGPVSQEEANISSSSDASQQQSYMASALTVTRPGIKSNRDVQVQSHEAMETGVRDASPTRIIAFTSESQDTDFDHDIMDEVQATATRRTRSSSDILLRLLPFLDPSHIRTHSEQSAFRKASVGNLLACKSWRRQLSKLAKVALTLDGELKNMHDELTSMTCSPKYWISMIRGMPYPGVLASMKPADISRLGKELICMGRMAMIDTLLSTSRSANLVNILRDGRMATQTAPTLEARWSLAHKREFWAKFQEAQALYVRRELPGTDDGVLSHLVACMLAIRTQDTSDHQPTDIAEQCDQLLRWLATLNQQTQAKSTGCDIKTGHRCER